MMAINFGLANDYNDYNVFVFGNLSLSNTDAEGRGAVGGNATLSNYGVGAGIIPLPPSNTDPSFVVDGDINVTAGSNASGNTVINPNSNVINYTMGDPNGQFAVGTPIDFMAAEQYLKCASAFWSTLMPNGTGQVIFGQLNLTGTDETLNIFSLDSGNLFGSGLSWAQLNGINIIAPLDSTILINVDGAIIQYGSYQIFRNGTAAPGKMRVGSCGIFPRLCPGPTAPPPFTVPCWPPLLRLIPPTARSMAISFLTVIPETPKATMSCLSASCPRPLPAC